MRDGQGQSAHVIGTWASSLAPGHAGLRAVFRDQFGREPELESGDLAVSATNAVTAHTASLWSRRRPLFWDAQRGTYLRADDPAELDALAPLLRAGAAWPALDDCVVFQDRQGVMLFASASGASTFYYIDKDGVLAFATRPQDIHAVRSAPVDRLGLGEIVRFGANYGSRTLLRDVRRLPIGHVLDCRANRLPEQRAFMDYSYRPDDSIDETEMREAIAAGLDRNMSLIDGPRDLLFSGGVDSALLGLLGTRGGNVQDAWFYAVSSADPQRRVAEGAAAVIGLRLRTVEDDTTPEDIMRRVAAYGSPTLDFSIVPTYALGSAVLRARGSTTFIDGTGGDAWFGFGSLAHAQAWLPLNRFRAFSPAARRLYLAMLPWENLRALRPVKGLARTPVLPSAGLGHMCANPVYSALLELEAEEWLTIEREVFEVMNSLTRGQLDSAAAEVVVSDACMIAVSQFAAKTSQWDLAGRAPTFYPFLMPNMVALGRTMPPRLLMRDGSAKPLLKDLVAASSLGRDFAYRRKSGFQPPLQRLLQNHAARELLFAHCDSADEAFWTPAARRLGPRLLRDKNSLRIGGLYAIWARLAVTIWLKSLRQLGA